MLILNAVVWKEVHHLLDHQHRDVLRCDSHRAHLHNDAYAPEDCFVCFFHFSPVELVADKIWAVPEVSFLTAAVFSAETTFSTQDPHLFYLRGPPFTG